MGEKYNNFMAQTVKMQFCRAIALSDSLLVALNQMITNACICLKSDSFEKSLNL